MFTGALGPDKDRVFLVIDKDVVGIPSDLQGIRREEFTYGGQDLSSGKKEALLDNELTRIAENIVRTISQYTDDRVHPTRGLKLPVLTTAQLLSRELPSPGGKLATPGSVVYVNALEPIEAVDSKFSERVVQNVLNDDVSYTYVFNQNKTIFANIKKMINLFVKEIRRKSSAYAKEHNINEARRFEDSLNKFSKKVDIYFVSDYPPFEFCVHNVYANEARCYMKHSNPDMNAKQEEKNVWVEWYGSPIANQFRLELQRIAIEDIDEPGRIFRDAIHCRIHSQSISLSAETLTEFGLGLVRELVPDAVVARDKEHTRITTYNERDNRIIRFCFGFSL